MSVFFVCLFFYCSFFSLLVFFYCLFSFSPKWGLYGLGAWSLGEQRGPWASSVYRGRAGCPWTSGVYRGRAACSLFEQSASCSSSLLREDAKVDWTLADGGVNVCERRLDRLQMTDGTLANDGLRNADCSPQPPRRRSRSSCPRSRAPRPRRWRVMCRRWCPRSWSGWCVI